jgi:hypothetical protein
MVAVVETWMLLVHWILLRNIEAELMIFGHSSPQKSCLENFGFQTGRSYLWLLFLVEFEFNLFASCLVE